MIYFSWITLSFIFGFIGKDRRIDYWPTVLLSLFLSPIIGLIFALASKRIEDMPTSNYRSTNSSNDFSQKNYWTCPKCTNKNSNSTFKCTKCDYSLV